MESPNNEGDRVLRGHLPAWNKASITETGLHPIELLVKGVPQKSPNYPGCCQDNRFLSTHRQQGPTAEESTHTNIEHGEGELVLI